MDHLKPENVRVPINSALRDSQNVQSILQSPSRAIPPVEKSRLGSTERKAVQYLNQKLTASLTALSEKPVPLICRNGSLVVFENGETLYRYQARDVQRMYYRELEGSATLLAYDMGCARHVLSPTDPDDAFVSQTRENCYCLGVDLHEPHSEARNFTNHPVSNLSVPRPSKLDFYLA